MYQIESLDEAQARAYFDELICLLRDAVHSGASVGFVPPLDDAVARGYWQEVFTAIAGGHLILLAALAESKVLGSVQLALARELNGLHRAEVKKLLVHRRARRKGLGRALMLEIEKRARNLGRSLLVLDTRRGDPAEQLYLKLGYSSAGVIPRYALNALGGLDDTVLLYRELSSQPV